MVNELLGQLLQIDPNDVPINIDRNPGHVCPSRDNPMIVFSLTVGATPGVGNVTSEELRPHAVTKIKIVKKITSHGFC